MDVIALEHELNSELLRFKLALKRAEALLLIPVIDAERREEEIELYLGIGARGLKDVLRDVAGEP